VLCRRISMTTRLTGPDKWPPLDTDLAGFGFLDEPIPGPPSPMSAGELVVVRHAHSKIVVEVAPEIEPDDEVIAQVQLAYEAEYAAAGLPVPFDDLVVYLLAEDSEWFDTPRPPLSELVRAAGLEIHGNEIAADESVWRAGAAVRRLSCVAHLARDDEQCDAGFRILEAFEAVTRDDPHGPEITVDAAYLRHTLDLMADPELLSIVTDQFFLGEDEPAAVAAAAGFASRLTAAASRPLQHATAAWLSAIVSERRGDPLAAAEALADSVRHSSDFSPAVDRLAWTRADQGRAAEAKALWSRVQAPDHPDLTCVEAATAGPTIPGAARMRRNDPCWCGSGRKYKVCHLRVTELPPLPDRFGWMLRKPIGYLERRGDPVVDVVVSLAWRLADEDSENLAEVMQDPLVLDLVLLEHGWFERFLAERGALLPADERLLYAAWLLVARTLYEVVGIRRDEGVALRDLRTGDVTEVEDRAFSREAASGEVICARALPAGSGHRFGPAIFSVPPGHEQRLLEILDRPDGTSIADGLVSYFAAATRPPSLVTTEGEPLRHCELVFEVADARLAREFLDRSYERVATDQWHQKHDVRGQPVIRALCRLAASTLTVQTMSEQRMLAISQELKAALPAAVIVSEINEPFDLDAAPDLASPAEVVSVDTTDVDTRSALTRWLEQQEKRWCAEPVTALGDLTPEQAAADPTRREQVIRLIDSYGPDGGVTDDGVVTMRPNRLRELLGLGVG
jgi:hypothetical protein